MADDGECREEKPHLTLMSNSWKPWLKRRNGCHREGLGKRMAVVTAVDDVSKCIGVGEDEIGHHDRNCPSDEVKHRIDLEL